MGGMNYDPAKVRITLDGREIAGLPPEPVKPCCYPGATPIEAYEHDMIAARIQCGEHDGKIAMICRRCATYPDGERVVR